MAEKKICKVRMNFTLTPKCIDRLIKLKKNTFPELSYSQLVERAIIQYANKFSD